MSEYEMEKLIREVEDCAAIASEGPCDLGIASPDMDPAAWFVENCSHGSGDIHLVWLPEHPLSTGKRDHPDHAVTLAITGNGPKSEANALAIATYWEAAPRLAAEVSRLAAEVSHLKGMLLAATNENARLAAENAELRKVMERLASRSCTNCLEPYLVSPPCDDSLHVAVCALEAKR